MSDNVSIKQDENDKRDEEEDGDHEDEVKFWPKIFNFCLADCGVRVKFVLDHGHDWSCQPECKDPRYDASQAS